MKIFVGSLVAALVVFTTATPMKRAARLPCTVNGVEYADGTTFSIPGSECFVYACNDGSSSLIEAGCKDSEGSCRDVGEVWTSGPCVNYKCVTEERNGFTYYSTKLDSIGCAGQDGTCHDLGSSWKYGCTNYQCTSEVRDDGKTYIITSVQSVECKDKDGNCQTEDDIFPLIIQGTTYNNCRCTITGTSISYKCAPN